MVTVSKRIEYGLAFVLFLSKDRGVLLSLKEAAEILGLPYRFLGKIATDLREAGIIESKEGKNGGYKLGEGWGERSVYDFLEALGENKRMVACLSGESDCGREKGCKIKGLWLGVERALTDELKRVKLSEIAL